MNISCNSTKGVINRTLDEWNWNIQRPYSFLASHGCSSVASFHFKEEPNEYTSEGTARLAKGRWSPIASTVEDEIVSYRIDTIPSNTTFSSEKLPMQPSVNPLYLPPIYDQEHHIQRRYNIARPARKTSIKVAPVKDQIPLSLRSSQQVRHMHKWQPRPEDVASIPISPGAPPPIISLLSYPKQNHAQVTASVISSTVSTPVLSSVSLDTNDYDYLNSPILPSASCTPMDCPVPHIEVPPVLNLDNNFHISTFPKQISCNINMVQAQERGLKNKQKSNAEEKSMTKIPERYEEQNVWFGSCKYDEYLHNGASNLFINWWGSKAKLVEKLKSFNLKVLDVKRTNDENVSNVIFESHRMARKAFTHQYETRLRTVPPRNSHLNWLRNPSPKFPVLFEAKSRLVVKNGKAESHAIVGELLKGCLIWADQLKGRRIRVASCEGRFMFPGGKIVEMKGLPHMSAVKSSLGWITYRCKDTKELLIKRRSMHLLSHYILDE